MKSKRTLFLFTLVLTALFSLSLLAVTPQPALAQSNGGLVPCGIGNDKASQCDFCYLIQLFQNVVRFIIVDLAAPIATLMFAWAGIRMMVNATDSGERSTAKKMLTDVVVGFILILLAWQIVLLIINTLVKSETIPGAAGGSWFVVSCARESGTLLTDLNPITYNNNQIVVSGLTSGDGALSNAAAKQQIESAGAFITSSGNCDNRNVSSCTSLEGMEQKTVNAIVTMQLACQQSVPGCKVPVSGGTEVGHTAGSTHNSGVAFDASATANASFAKYMTQQLTAANGGKMPPANTPVLVDIGGVKYKAMYEVSSGGVDRTPHYHIQSL